MDIWSPGCRSGSWTTLLPSPTMSHFFFCSKCFRSAEISSFSLDGRNGSSRRPQELSQLSGEQRQDKVAEQPASLCPLAQAHQLEINLI